MGETRLTRPGRGEVRSSVWVGQGRVRRLEGVSLLPAQIGLAWPGLAWMSGAGRRRKGRTGTAGVGHRGAWTVDATRGKYCWFFHTGRHQGIIFVLYGYACSLETKQFLYGNPEGRVVLTRVVSPVNKAQAPPRGVMAAHIKTWQKSLRHVLSKEGTFGSLLFHKVKYFKYPNFSQLSAFFFNSEAWCRSALE